MAKITVTNFKGADDKGDKIVSVDGWNSYTPDGAYMAIKRILDAYKSMWPEDDKLNKIYLVRLP